MQCAIRLGSFRRRAWRGLASACVALLLGTAFSQPATADERAHKVEAAFLYNFFNYITWPDYQSPEQMQQATICVPTGDPILPSLEYIRSRREGEHELMIREMDNNADMEGCQLLFVRNPGVAESARLRAIERSRDEAREVAFVAHFVRLRARDVTDRAFGDRVLIGVKVSTMQRRGVFDRKFNAGVGFAGAQRLRKGCFLNGVEIVIAVAVDAELESAARGRERGVLQHGAS